MSVSERYKYFTGTLMHKHINNPSDNLLNNFLFNIFFYFDKNVHNHKMRKDHFTIPEHRTEQFKLSFAFSGPKIWNNMDIEARKLDLQNLKNY